MAKVVIVSGTRNFNDYSLLKRKLDKILAKIKEIEIVTGAAKGADQLAEKWAYENFPRVKVVKRFHPDWGKYGKAAGPMRNREMAVYAASRKGILIAFWDGSSPGTEDMIAQAKNKGMKVRVIRYGESS